MNFNSFFPWNWAKLDPKRAQAARAHYDVKGKYDLWQAYCRQQFQRKNSPPSSELATKGVEVVRLLSAPEAADVKALLLANALQFSAAKKGINYADVMRFKETKFLRPVVEKIFSPALDRKIIDIYGSEYFVHSIVANRTMPAKTSKRSFLWHCDHGPKNFLKINMFLDATSEHGATTEFLDMPTSEGFERIGYTFGAVTRRVADLRPIARKFGGTVNVIHLELDAGEAFIFHGSRCLHRGFLPTRGIRHMLTVVLLPSPVHWTEAWKRPSETGFHMKSGETFPDNAEQLYTELGLVVQPLDYAA